MIALLFLILAGFGWSRLLDRDAGVMGALAESLLIGCGVAALGLLVLDLSHVAWSPLSLVLATAVIAIPPWLARAVTLPPSNLTATLTRPSVLLINLVTAFLVIKHAVDCCRADLWDWSHWLISRRDFFFIWGYKAHLFFAERAIPWRFLAALPNDFSHPDYPLLVPLLFDVEPVLTGTWQPHAIGPLHAALGAALLVIAHRCLRRDFDGTFAALGTLALAGAALVPWPGFADGPLVAFAAGAALLARLGYAGTPAALLVLAVFTKNEGTALAMAMAIAAALYSRKQIRTLVPAAVAVAAWMLVRLSLGMHTDLFTGDFFGRAVRNGPHLARAFAAVPTHQPLLWMAALVAIALRPAENLRRERFLLTIAVLQLGFYLGAYLVTPLDVPGHVNGSWERISSHVTMLVAFAGVTSIGERLRR